MLFVFKELMSNGSGLLQRGKMKAHDDLIKWKQPKLNKHSKILKEFNKIFAYGHSKVSFLDLKCDKLIN
jgi:hypothetical protein